MDDLVINVKMHRHCQLSLESKMKLAKTHQFLVSFNTGATFWKKNLSSLMNYVKKKKITEIL